MRLLPFCTSVLALLFLLAGCQKSGPAPGPGDPPGPPWFEDVTAKVGLAFTHDAGPADGKYFMPQIIGSGGALFDCDGDGRLDILLLQNGGPEGKKNALFRQREDGTFEDVSKGSGLDRAGFFMGAAVGDVNNDGLPDVCLTSYGGIFLFMNQGKGVFKESKDVGLVDPLWSTSAAFLDYNRDGWLDLFVCHYVDFDPSWVCTASSGRRDFCAPKTFPGTVDFLFRNKGDGTFEEVSVAAGVGLTAGPGLGVLCADFSGDGWPDIFVANDASANHLWVNQKNGTFKDEALGRGLAFNGMGKAEGDMGIGWGDVDGDGLQDLLVTHLGQETNTLWKQGPTAGTFRDQTFRTLLDRPRWKATGFGAALADLDNDGDLDAAVVNGRVFKGPTVPGADLGPFWSGYAERDQLFANDGTGRFADLSEDNDPFCGTPLVGRGLAVGDVNGDGGLDLLVTSIGSPVRLFFNVAPDRGHWLLVRPLAGKRDALGADVTVHAGKKKWTRTVVRSASYLCGNDPRAHFGLGDVDKVDRIEVAWPDGTREVFAGGPADRVVTLYQGEGDKP